MCRLVVTMAHVRVEVNSVEPSDSARYFINPDFGEDLRVSQLLRGAFAGGLGGPS
jgi:hypothetical protein